MDRLDDSIRRQVDRLGGPAGGLTELVAGWPALVGEGIARNAWPARVARDGTLHVHTSSSAWGFELTQLAPTILVRLRSELGEKAPVALRFAPGPLPEGGIEATDEPGTSPPSIKQEHRKEAAELAASIEDEELRELVARAAAASLATAAADRSL
jgi:hypothetical protein